MPSSVEDEEEKLIEELDSEKEQAGLSWATLEFQVKVRSKYSANVR